MNHSEMVAALAQTLPYRKLYIELGVQYGATFGLVAPLFERAIGVDLNPCAACAEFYQMSTDEFFEKAGRWISPDFIFIDADHRAAQVYKDALNSLQIIRPLTGLVVLHDTYPANESELAPEFCEDAWKAAQRLRQLAWIESVTLPGLHGLTVCRRVELQRHLHWLK